MLAEDLTSSPAQPPLPDPGGKGYLTQITGQSPGLPGCTALHLERTCRGRCPVGGSWPELSIRGERNRLPRLYHGWTSGGPDGPWVTVGQPSVV